MSKEPKQSPFLKFALDVASKLLVEFLEGFVSGKHEAAVVLVNGTRCEMRLIQGIATHHGQYARTPPPVLTPLPTEGSPETAKYDNVGGAHVESCLPGTGGAAETIFGYEFDRDGVTYRACVYLKHGHHREAGAAVWKKGEPTLAGDDFDGALEKSAEKMIHFIQGKAPQTVYSKDGAARSLRVPLIGVDDVSVPALSSGKVITVCIDSNDNVEPSWCRIGGSLTRISVGGRRDVVWGVNRDHEVFSFDGRTGRWVHIDGSLSHVSVGSDGVVWGVNEKNEIYRRGGDRWIRVTEGSSLSMVSVGDASNIWGVNKDQHIYYYDGKWKRVEGKLSWVSVGNDGEVWGVNKDQHIYRRVGDGWTKVDGELTRVSVGNAGNVWGVNEEGKVYRREGGGWSPIGGTLNQVSVGSNGDVWGVNEEGQIYYYFDRIGS